MITRHRRLARSAALGALLLSFSSAVFTAQLKENSADIQQIVNIPGMMVAINPGGVGCSAAKNEKWEPTANGCSNNEALKLTARVVSVTTSPASIIANNISTSTLLATVKYSDGALVSAGIPTSWSTSSGTLSSTSTVTNASGQTSVTLRGTVAGVAKVTATAVAGSASANVDLLADPSTSRVISLTPTPASVPVNGAGAQLFAVVRDAYNNILPAGQPVYWTTTLNGLNTGVSNTDAGGTAVASIAGATAGVATINARTAVSANASTNVTFTSVAPPPITTETRGDDNNSLDCWGWNVGSGYEYMCNLYWDGKLIWGDWLWCCSSYPYTFDRVIDGIRYKAAGLFKSVPTPDTEDDGRDWYRITRSKP